MDRQKLVLGSVFFFAWLIGCGSDGPDPVDFGLTDAPACELSADCPNGSYCELGICYQACSSKKSCSGGDSCSERGRCSGSGDSNDVPIETERAVTLSVEQELLDFGNDRDTVTLTLKSDNPDVSLRYRISNDVPWIKIADEDRLADFKGEKEITLEVDREAAGSGTAQGFVSVYSYGGDALVPAVVQNNLEGMYRGVVAYEDPGLGQMPIRFAVKQKDDGNYDLYIDPNYSFGYMEKEDGGWPGASVTIDGNGNLGASFGQVIDPNELDADFLRSLYFRTIARSVNFSLSSTQAGILQGELIESWHGILRSGFDLSATIFVVRETDTDLPELGEASSDSFDAIDYDYEFSNGNTTTSCYEWAESLTGLSSCTASNQTLLLCAESVVNDAESPEKAFNADSTAIELTFSNLGKQCQDESHVPENPGTCWSFGKTHCAGQLSIEFWGTESETDGARMLVEAIDGAVQAATVAVQERIVESYRAEFESTGDSVRTTLMDMLDEARVYMGYPVNFFWSSNAFLPVMMKLRPEDASATDYKHIRNMATLLSRRWDAQKYYLELALQTRWKQVDPLAYVAELRSSMNKDHLQRFPLAAVLSHMAKKQEASELPHLFELDESFSDAGRLYVQLLEQPDSVFGKDPSYVPFIYDVRQAQDKGPTNLAQLISRAEERVLEADAKEREARDYVMEVATKEFTLEDRLIEAQSSFQSQLLEVCGGSASSPDVEKCGSSGGALRQAAIGVEQSQTGIRLAEQRTRAQRQRIRAQVSRLSQVHGIRQENLQFVNSQNEEIVNITEDQNTSSFWGDLLGIAGDAITLGYGIVTANPGIIAASGPRVAQPFLNKKVSSLEAQKEQAQLAKEMALLEGDYKVEYINGMTQMKELAIGITELRIEQTQAALDYSAQLVHAQDLSNQAQFTAQQYDRIRAHLNGERFGGLNDPTLRMLRDEKVVLAMAARERAREAVFDAAKAFEYEVNTSLPGIYTELISAFNASEILDFFGCLKRQAEDVGLVYGAPQAKTLELSLKEDILKIRGSIKDPQTGREISAREQFQRLLFKPNQIEDDGTVNLPFATSLSLNNGAFSTGLCNDFVTGVRVKLIGDGLGDDQAIVRLVQKGVSFVRSCESPDSVVEDIVYSYELAPREAEIDAGVNTYRDDIDTQFFGRSVAASDWVISFPPAEQAPQNDDLDLSRLEDIIFELKREAITLSDYTGSFAPSCEL
ncbi:MAG: hypothetical protein IPJ88_15370 [Myxococcales bacterium]|nr:MAG: hypothetical protein IPJ88_15370 [Myxococcales bacterium]